MSFTESTRDKYGRETIKPSKLAYIVIGIVVLVLLFFVFCFRTVQERQVGIITRFGTVNRTANSGIALKLPWPIERMNKMDTSIQKEEQTSSAATKDLQDVKATLALNYALDDKTAVNIYKTIGADYKERIITPAVQESFKAASAGYTASELITERTAVKSKAYDVIKSRLEKYSIRVVDLNIVNFQFSPEYSQAIEAVQVANQNVAKARQELETTKVQAEKDIQAAQGQAEAQRLQQQTLTPELIQKYQIDNTYAAIQKWDGKLPTYTGASGAIFNLPLQGN
jgi:regulator of protease activity HflC (stomatin/prohibitin superfamily)